MRLPSAGAVVYRLGATEDGVWYRSTPRSMVLLAFANSARLNRVPSSMHRFSPERRDWQQLSLQTRRCIRGPGAPHSDCRKRAVSRLRAVHHEVIRSCTRALAGARLLCASVRCVGSVTLWRWQSHGQLLGVFSGISCQCLQVGNFRCRSSSVAEPLALFMPRAPAPGLDLGVPRCQCQRRRQAGCQCHRDFQAASDPRSDGP